ncbi:MAG: glycoside hydrolase family 32 protein [Fimbriimonas sp.]
MQKEERDERLAKAMASVWEGIAAAEADPNRPMYHFRPPALWMNDPNGTIYHDGWYHVFYQHNPYGPNWGHMHWGHARSRDLVNWEHLPIAIPPTGSKGEDHIYSGSTFIAPNGKAKIFYTSISGQRPPEQWQAEPEDAEWIRWTKPQPSEVVTTATHAPTDLQEWRDPFLITEGGRTYMLVGGRLDGKGSVSVYRAKDADLKEWEYHGILFTHPDVDVIECPNLAKLGDKWVLFASTYAGGARFVVETFVGTLDLEKPAFTTERRGTIGEGSYASQLLRDEAGRLIYFAWNRIEGNEGWNGCLNIPSVLTLEADGTLRAAPIEAIANLRGAAWSREATNLEGTMDLTPEVSGRALELAVEIDPGTAKRLRLTLNQFELDYDVAARSLAMTHRIPASLPGETLKLRLFLDRSVLDLYAQDGALFQTSYKPMGEEETALTISAEGGEAKRVSMRVYEVRPAEFDLSHFKESV